jgi:glyoxylase-like metal-dependent hydrolase (beta-lactamase superfamily II)
MKIHVFQSYQGDCLMVEDAAEQHRILCDGGTPRAMKDFVAAELAAWQQAGKRIDLAYVSHIDSDHIGGIAVLLDLAVQWKVFDFHAAQGRAGVAATTGHRWLVAQRVP